MRIYFDIVRDDIIFHPYFTIIIWLVVFLVICVEIAGKQDTEFALLIILAFLVFTLPCLQWLWRWASLYQMKLKSGERIKPEETLFASTMIKRKKALTEEEMIGAVKARQSRKASKVFSAATVRHCDQHIITELQL